MPAWLQSLSFVSLTLGGVCALVIAADLLRHPQQMWIMGVVWPVSALFGGIWIVWQYFRYGRLTERRVPQGAVRGHLAARSEDDTPLRVAVSQATLHCGSGCTLGDLLAEWLVLVAPVIATWFGWQHLFQEKIFAVWILDYLFAYAFGIVFQYFTIAPMRGLTLRAGLRAALTADTLSLTAWQLGMYGFMAFAYFYLFRDRLQMQLTADRPEFWFMMQLAMICGFVTSYPVNWWLIQRGIKQRM